MKKLISFLLVTVLLAGMAFSASAAVAKGKIDTIDETGFSATFELMAKSGLITLDGKAVASAEALEDLTVKPGSELKIQVPPVLFKDSAGAKLGTITDTIPYTSLKNGRITLRTAIPESAPVEKVTIAGEKNATIITVLFDNTPTINKISFNFSLYFAKNGSRKQATRMYIGGTLGATAVDIYDDDFVDLSDGKIARAAETIRKAEFYLGDYFYITRGLSRNKKVAGTATTELDAAGERLMVKYPYLEYIYTIKTVGLKTEGNIVSFELDENYDDIVYYVYNTNGTYIGRSNQKLPYWTKYYLTSKKYDALVVK